MSVPSTIGRYRLGPRLGAGGYAVVWLAHDESLDTLIAIKVMAENWMDQADLRDRFLAEARMLRRASSSRVVQVFDVGEMPDGRPYFVMEHADLGTLEDRLAKGRLPLVEALRVTAEVARGAAELHRLGIVHRDLKPSNVLIRSTPDGGERLLIADLGVAKNLTQGTGLTMSVGSAGYMAPEQTRDSRVDARADVYSLGALGFDLITGQQPPTSGPVLPKRSHPDLPEQVRQVLKQALEPDRERRWQEAATLADRLDELADQFESRPRSASMAQPGRERSGFSGWVRARRVVLATGLLIVVLGGVGFRLLEQNPVDETQSQSSNQSSPAPTVPASATGAQLTDGELFGLLERSSKGKITVRIVNPLLDAAALEQCRKDLGPEVPSDAVCGKFYFDEIESSTRVLPVSKKASITYVSSDDGDRRTLDELTGVDVDSLSRVSHQYQQGRLFYLTLKNGVVNAGASFFPLCRDIDGLDEPDGRSEWTSKCVPWGSAQ